MSEQSTTFDEAFDPTQEEGTPPRNILPAGRYRAEVVDGSIADTQNRKGTMLYLTWSILDDGGQFDRRMVFQGILVRHESADAQRYGRYKLKDLCDACGITEPVTDIKVLFYKPCLISVGIERDREGIYSDKNKVTRIMPVPPAGVPPAAPLTPPPATPPSSNGPATKPAKEEFRTKFPF